MDGATGAAGRGPAPVSYGFYQDGYGGTLVAADFSEVMPAAVRMVGSLTDAREVQGGWGDDQVDAWRRAVCAAADAFAEYGDRKSVV